MVCWDNNITSGTVANNNKRIVWALLIKEQECLHE